MNRFTVVRLDVLDAAAPVEHLLDVVVPVIDGMPLSTYVGDDAMPGLVLSLVAPPSRLWLGRPDDEFGDGRTTVLDGSCGVAGCCGVRARVSVGDDVVTWGEFVVGPGHELDLGPFEFDRSAYETTLAGCASLPPVAWRLNPRADADRDDDEEPRAPLVERLREGAVSVIEWPVDLWRRRQLRRRYPDALFSRRFGRRGGWCTYVSASADDSDDEPND